MVHDMHEFWNKADLIFIRRNLFTAKFPTAKFPYGEISHGEISYGEISYGEISGHAREYSSDAQKQKNGSRTLLPTALKKLRTPTKFLLIKKFILSQPVLHISRHQSHLRSL